MEETRKSRIRYAYEMIVRDGHAVCVCGQLFLTEDGYANHVEACEQRARSEAAAGRFGKD